jgi:phenylacetate-CoA ligase
MTDGDRDEVLHAMHERLGLRAELRVFTPGALPRTEVGKAVRVLRWRDGAPPVPGL